MLSRNVCKKITTTRFVVSQKSAVLLYLAAEAWNNALHIYLSVLFFATGQSLVQDESYFVQAVRAYGRTGK